MNVLVRALRLSFVSALLLCSSAVFAQGPAPRIRGAIELSPSTPLAGSLNPHLRTAEDLGPLSPDTVISGITLVFSRSAAQEADLQQLLAQQTNPSSPLFHHWLTPDTFAARFGVADSDIAATTAWLQSHGFTIDPQSSRNPDRITFSGTAAEIHQAFGAELHHFRWPAGNGQPAELHFAPASELSLPSSLAPVTAAVLHLSDFRLKPNVRPHPNYTTLSTQTHFLSPDDIFTMYDFWPLNGHSYAANQSLAIVGQSYVPTGANSAVANFASVNINTGVSVTPILVPGSGVEAVIPGDEGEADIDIEYSSSTARGSNIYYVFTGSSPNYDVNDAIAFAITHQIAPVISISYSECEPLLTATEAQQINALFEQAAAQGQTIVAASGDQGATACAPYDSSSGLTTTQQQDLAVEFPASSPYVTAVGGTQMAPGTFASGSSTYWNAATTTDLIGSLVAYTPEVVWNEDSSTQGIIASGGGASTLFARPSWQSGVPGIPSGSFRLVPDIALQASVSNPGYIICSDDFAFTGGVSDCTNGNLKDSNGVYILDGGTSFSAPIFAGLIAFLNGYEQTNGQGNVNPVLYSLAAQPTVYASAFHDITTGTTACVSGDGNCSTPGESNFASTAGYDQATGLGSLDFTNLVAAWPVSPSKNLIQTYLSVGGTTRTANPGAPIALPIEIFESSITGAPGPTGSVSLNIDGSASVSLPLTVSNTDSTASYTFDAPSTTGSHTVSLIYPGDATHSGSTATIAVMVGSPLATGNVSLSANSVSISNNTAGSTSVTVTPSGGYNGMLTWSLSITGGTVSTNYCYFIDAPPINGVTTGTVHLGVGTICTSPTGLQSPSTVQRSSAAYRPTSRAARIPAAAVFALLLVGIVPSRRRKLLPILALAALAILPVTVIGCGGGSGGAGGGGGNNPQPQVYTVTLTAKDSVQTSITASTTFTLTVD